MQKQIIAAAAIGFTAFGALLGWAVTADHYEKKLRAYETDLELDFEHAETIAPHVTADVETTMSMYRATSVEEVVSEPSSTETHVEVSEAVVDQEEPAQEGPPENREKIRANLQKLIDKYAASDEVVEEFGEVIIEQMKLDKTPPEVISVEEYAWSEDAEDHTKITLRYFPSSRVVLDEDEDVIDDVANTIGWRNLQHFGDRSNSPDTVYIRNRRILTDFEVVRELEEDLPPHVRFGMSKTEYEAKKAAGLIQ